MTGIAGSSARWSAATTRHRRRLFGAVAILRDRAEDIERPERQLIPPWIASVRDELGVEAFTREWTAGNALSLDIALAEADGLLAAWGWTASGDPARNRRVGA